MTLDAPRAARRLEHIQKKLSTRSVKGTATAKPVEWFLDNYYLIRRVARQVEEELPRGFLRHLPPLASADAPRVSMATGTVRRTALLRIEALAESVVTNEGMDIDLPGLRRFVDAYQEKSVLTIAELWALPNMLRGAVLRHLLHFLDALDALDAADAGAPTTVALQPNEPTTALNPTLGVERSIRALRFLDVIDWKLFFEKTNRVEAILQTDPAGIYGHMDFETCDSYRKVVERIAWNTGLPEEEVTRAAIALAEATSTMPHHHVGYFLVAEGRSIFEAHVGYRAKGWDRLRSWVEKWPALAYLLPLASMTALPIALVGGALLLSSSSSSFSQSHGARVAWIVLAALVAVVPVSTAAVAALRNAFGRLLPPRTLPKLDLSKGLAGDMRTLVVIPTLLGSDKDVASMTRQIELHYLANPDPQIGFALLTDDVDTVEKAATTDPRDLLQRVSRAIAALNVKHAKTPGGPGPFHLLHRDSRWNAAEGRFMGWERKRGKLDELNRMLRSGVVSDYARHVGDASGLVGIRFVLTLDSDTELPMGSAHRLVGTLAHPLNQAVFDAATNRVVSGYTLVQPRIETSPSSARATPFARMFSGDVGFDIYTRACSELYQDLFGSGIYVGKGLYEVDPFMRSVDGRVPENTLVSHDLFEGVHGRVALASDIVLFEGYPASYLSYAARMHRWVRGDWQLVPWLWTRVPSGASEGERTANALAPIDRWKIADNLRRSAESICLLTLLLLGWVVLPGHAFIWTLAVLAMLVGPRLPGVRDVHRVRRESLERCALAIVFLAYEATVAADAIVRVLVRKAITGKHLLQWTSAAHVADMMDRVSPRSQRAMYWKTLAASPILAIVLGLLVCWLRPSSRLAAAPLLAIFFVAPEVAGAISRPTRRRPESPLSETDRTMLRLLARRTWRFFDAFVGPGDQWLPVDNHQEEPHEQTAHRTSPTNIGLMLLATLSAYDFGYIGPSQLSLRLRRAFDSIARLPHYQGHLLNWYDTKNLQPLLPRYVSTVDSGNFAGALLALKQGCRDVIAAPVLRVQAWDGLRDSIDLLEEVVLSVPTRSGKALTNVLVHMKECTNKARGDLPTGYAILRELCEVTSPELDRELLAFLESGAERHEADLLRALRTAIERLHQQLREFRLELETLLPWLTLRDEAERHALAWPTDLLLGDIAPVARRLRIDLAANNVIAKGSDDSAARLEDAFRRAEAHGETLVAELEALARHADDEARGMDFKLLYDRDRRLFHIGYNATIDQIDPNYYDLLASEARLASYLAIVKRDVPVAHWYALGRPMTDVAGPPALLSWGGTMFEYLMPGLLMESQDDTLLEQTCALAVKAQIASRKGTEPWGVSESAYAHLDADQTYQYRSFGVPGLGFKRGLEENRVVAPYASVLAVAIRPKAVVDNVNELRAMGMLGTYGLFESVDFTPERVSSHAGSHQGEPYEIVRSYMAHHQGMILVALGNFLNPRSMVERFHADAMIETGEMLLNEHAPDVAPAEWPLAKAEQTTEVAHGPLAHAMPTWDSPSHEEAGNQAFVLGNGHLTSVVTSGGGGGLIWRGLAVTRFTPDASRDEDGLWFYLRDEETEHVWLGTSNEGRMTYTAHRAELHLRAEGISVHVDVAVAASDDVEVRQITLHNETDRPRVLTVTSAGRPVLLPIAQASVHPAFAGLFVESERLEELDAIAFARRPQSPDEEPAVLVHRLVRDGAAATFAGFETERGAFFGRCGTREKPLALVTSRKDGARAHQGRTGAVLDPIVSLTARVELKPKTSVTIAFVTSVARSKSDAVDLARKYGSMHAVRWAFLDAEQESPRRLERANLDPTLLPAAQRLFSAMLFADPAFRAPLDIRTNAHPNQRRLWGRGISGDDAIVLVRVKDPDAPIVRETLAVQRYLRSCGVRLDLVLIDELASGYVTEGAGTLRTLLQHSDAVTWLDRHGGIFVVTADQVSPEDLRHLEGCARVVLDSRDGTMAARFARTAESPPKLPRFEATVPEEAETETAPPDRSPPRGGNERLFGNGLGGFTPEGREYVIDVAAGAPTPAPWCNVLANPAFGCLVSESSLGSSWSLNAGENRLTPWRNDPVFDTPSESVYLRDEETAAVWSPTPLPAGQDTPTRVRHGAGFTVYETESHGLVQEMTVFVPPDASLKVVRLRVTNRLPRHRRLTATYYAEWVLGSRREAQRPFITSEIDRAHACILASCDWNEEFRGRVAFVAAKENIHGFTFDRGEFLGPRGSYARPEALERWGLSGRAFVGADPCAALQVHLDLKPGESIETHFLLGQAASREEALDLVQTYRGASAVDASWQRLESFWDKVLGTIRAKTPEPAMDLMLNRWLLYQSLSSRVFGRTAFYQSSGAFGYRDQLQDVLALLGVAPTLARAHILEAAKHQFEEGDVLHWWHPPSGRGVRTRCSDDLAWLPYVTAEYVMATGDDSILDEAVPFLTAPILRADEHDRYAQYDASATSASLFEHCRRALTHACTEGAHGLPLMGDGDWNDGMSRIGAEGRGESVWLAWFLISTSEKFSVLSRRRNDVVEAEKWTASADRLRTKVQDAAWDGAWYVRAFHDDGSLVGSAKSRECKIDSIAQSWSALSVPKSDTEQVRSHAAVHAADAQLVREKERLVLLFTPPFDTTLHDPGYVRAYPPGVRENGGQYTHASTWLGFAYAALGEGTAAERIFRLLNPVLHSSSSAECALYRVEPYVLAGDIYSESPWTGRGGWTWYTGAAAWLWRLGSEAILGVKFLDGHLFLDPCIPAAWDGFEAWVRKDEGSFHVVVENPDHVSSGIASLSIDGTEADRASLRAGIAWRGPGEHEVRVRLGSV